MWNAGYDPDPMPWWVCSNNTILLDLTPNHTDLNHHPTTTTVARRSSSRIALPRGDCRSVGRFPPPPPNNIYYESSFSTDLQYPY